jgi:hypothetical protein
VLSGFLFTCLQVNYRISAHIIYFVVQLLQLEVNFIKFSFAPWHRLRL